MSLEELIKHLVKHHDIHYGLAEKVIGSDEVYLRGFHDGLHGRVDADDFKGH